MIRDEVGIRTLQAGDDLLNRLRLDEMGLPEALLDSNALRQVSRLVDVGAAKDRHVVGEQL